MLTDFLQYKLKSTIKDASLKDFCFSFSDTKIKHKRQNAVSNDWKTNAS